MSSDPDNRVQLAEIRGDVKLILAGQERTHTDVQDIRRTLIEHNVRIASLETDRSIQEGERKGLNKGGRIVWSIISLIVGSSGVLALLEIIK